MSIFDNIPYISKTMAIAETVAEALRKLTENDRIMTKWQERGFLNAGFTVENYRVKFTIEDTNRTAIPADVTPTGEAE